MNIVNIRTAPINTIHKGGLEVMSKGGKKTENTGHKALGDETRGEDRR